MVFQLTNSWNLRRTARPGRTFKFIRTCVYFLFLGGLALEPAADSFLLAQEKGSVLSVSTEGYVPGSTSKSQDPTYVLELAKIQKLLIELAQGPKESSFFEAGLEGTGVTLSDLLSMHLVRKEDGLYVLGFSLFTVEDQRLLVEACEYFAGTLADIYWAKRAEFEKILSIYPLKNIKPTTLAFILLGCFSLDWDGLNITKKSGYRATPPLKTRPFIVYARDMRAKEFSAKKGLYWGSHNEYLKNRITFTTFGDHASLQRCGFPDLAWEMVRRIRTVKSPDEVNALLVREGRRVLYESLLTPLSDILMSLRAGKRSAEEICKATGSDLEQTKSYLILLQSLDYVQSVQDGYETKIPVIALEDRPMVQDIVKAGREIMTSWLKQNYEKIRTRLSDLSAFKYGQSMEETFYLIWHEIFGRTNRMLVEKGMFDDPYSSSRKFQGFIPVVWHRGVMDFD